MEEEFLQAYDTLADSIFRFFYFRLGDREKANDLTQDAFVKVWEYLKKGHEIEYLKAFIFKVARNLTIDYVRKKKEISLDSLMDSGFDPHANEHAKNSIAIDVHALLDAVSKINEKYIEVVRLRYIDDLSPKEVAKILDMTENAVSVRLSRGIQELRKYIDI